MNNRQLGQALTSALLKASQPVARFPYRVYVADGEWEQTVGRWATEKAAKAHLKRMADKYPTVGWELEK